MTVATLLAIGGPIVIALVAFGTYRLVGAALQPVERIRARVSSMTHSKLAERIPVPAADDEVTRLAVTMNNMLDRLEASQSAQRRFISDASHELRSPLASITAALDLAHRRPDLLDQSLIDDSLLPEAQRMHSLVEDLLLLARADERCGRNINIDVDLDDIVLAEAERIRSLTHLKVIADVKPARASWRPERFVAPRAQPGRQCRPACTRWHSTRMCGRWRQCPGARLGRRAGSTSSRSPTRVRSLRPTGHTARSSRRRRRPWSVDSRSDHRGTPWHRQCRRFAQRGSALRRGFTPSRRRSGSRHHERFRCCCRRTVDRSYGADI